MEGKTSWILKVPTIEMLYVTDPGEMPFFQGGNVKSFSLLQLEICFKNTMSFLFISSLEDTGVQQHNTEGKG